MWRDPAGIHSCPVRVGRPPEPSVAWRRGDPPLRSVHRECAGRAIEPRKLTTRGSRRHQICGRQHRCVEQASRRGPAGVREQGMRTRGSPRNLGDLAASIDDSRSGDRLPKPRPGAMRPSLLGANLGAWMVPPNEGNEVRREGRQGVAVSRTTREAGELPSGGPRGGKETPEDGPA